MSYVHPEYLVETDWVAQHLDDPKVRIIESDEDPLLYAMGHIPGAVQVDWFSTLQHPLRRDFLTKEQFEDVASKLGITNDTTVVFYGDKSNWFACYALWLFQYYRSPERQDHEWRTAQMGAGEAAACDGSSLVYPVNLQGE